MTTTDRTIPGLRGFDDEGFAFWEPEELDRELGAFLDEVKEAHSNHTAGALEETLYYLTSKADPTNDGTLFRERFITFMVRLADREVVRAEALRRRGASLAG